MANLYFDESGSHQDSRLLTVAGYWFEEIQAHRFSKEWRKHLAALGLSFAHMTDCALGYGEYQSLSMQKRIESEKRLIECIKRRTRFGFTVTVNPQEYDTILGPVEGAPTCYTHCLMTLFHGISRFADANRYSGTINYYFESGHSSQKEANKYLSSIPLHGDAWVKATRYKSHGFLDKKESLPLQAADMLAWQTRHYFERRLDGYSKPRKDLVALVRPFDLNVEMHANHLKALKDFIVEVEPLVASGQTLAGLQKGQQIYDRYGLKVVPPPVFK